MAGPVNPMDTTRVPRKYTKILGDLVKILSSISKFELTPTKTRLDGWYVTLLYAVGSIQFGLLILYVSTLSTPCLCGM